jgi:hypothetical protein
MGTVMTLTPEEVIFLAAFTGLTAEAQKLVRNELAVLAAAGGAP